MKQKLILCAFTMTSLLLTACFDRNVQDAQNNTGTKPATISEEEAKDIALSNAGVGADQATFIRSHVDIDDGKRIYDVEFYTADGKEYDYEIDPDSGNILDFDFDVENFMD